MTLSHSGPQTPVLSLAFTGWPGLCSPVQNAVGGGRVPVAGDPIPILPPKGATSSDKVTPVQFQFTKSLQHELMSFKCLISHQLKWGFNLLC